MNIDLAGELAPQVYLLAPQQPFLRLRNCSGTRIVCLSGTVLITACNEFRDIALCADQDFVVPNKGLVLVEAISDAAISLERRSRASWPWQSVPISIGFKGSQLP